MSEEQQIEVSKAEKFYLPQPFWPAPGLKKNGVYTPVDTLGETGKVVFFSGLFLGGMHIRRLIQRRRGSARPGTAHYLNMFDLEKRHFISIPLALGTYTFISNAYANVYEEKKPLNEFVAGAAAMFVATIFKPSMKASKRFGVSFGIGTIFAAFTWAGGAYLAENSLNSMRRDGKVNNQTDAQDIDAERKQGFWEVVYRRPLSQTISELGEGRGIGKL
ncbi:hypothetical protein B5S28_g3047 [[Candida] boidinii]|nr:hypothetical protein B5S28_g3047 [[Candida] boidinii]OWB62681.1 hypothetical protein B5S29_g3622 [[Candida] boidinii]OWB74350.1 hypothetical protein B5S31_g4139 [[Candida] boidinii]OWB78669.1 hypothetical protein B5S32_g2869 [[Candida] boidinii]